MSAPLRLTSDDLRNLASGLDAMTKSQRAYSAGPSRHMTLRTNEDILTFDIAWVEDADDSRGEWIIDDRFGS